MSVAISSYATLTETASFVAADEANLTHCQLDPNSCIVTNNATGLLLKMGAANDYVLDHEHGRIYRMINSTVAAGGSMDITYNYLVNP